MRRLRFPAVLLSTALTVAPLCAAADRAGEARALARSARDGSRLVAVAEGDQLAVRDGGREVAAQVPAGSRVRAVERAGAGWVLAGSTPAGDGGSEIWVQRGSDAGALPAVAPPGRVGNRRTAPVPLVSDSALVGLAWLEGDGPRTNEVRFSRWNGAGFEAPAVVAPSGKGSQLALTGTRLADGRLLLVWSGFDGTDDEIWASLGDSGGGWTPPMRVAADNRVPDITPDVTADGDGALVVWSRFDGSEYQAVMARFDGQRFSPPQPVAGPGSLYPTFERDGGRRGVLFLDARNDGWAVRELDQRGQPRRLGRLAERGASGRPLVGFSERGVDWQLDELREATAWE